MDGERTVRAERRLPLAAVAVTAMLCSSCGLASNLFFRGRSSVSFDFSPGGLGEAELLIVDIGSAGKSFSRQPVRAGRNEIKTRAGGIYVFGLVARNPAGRSAMGSGIAGSLFSMGNLATAIHDLDTIPAGADGSEALDLGALSPSNLVSSAGLSELESFSGYSASTLRDYAATDETVVKFLNPDIDGNGSMTSSRGWTGNSGSTTGSTCHGTT